MNDQPTWDQSVNELKEEFNFNGNFDLAKYFHELHLFKQSKDSRRHDFKQASEEQKRAKSLLKKSIKHLERAVTSLKEISLEGRRTLGISIKIEEIQLIIDLLGGHKIHSKNYPYSLPKMYISLLCGIFYKGTGEMPICACEREEEYGEEGRYTGNFYNFLLESKPLLKKIGIQLPKNETIGSYGSEVVNGNLKEGIPSFQELLEELEKEEIEIGEMRMALPVSS